MGALTAKPYAFKARFWELSETSVFDPLDSFHSPIRIELRGTEIMRVLPDIRYTNVNEWISDRARFSYDSLYTNRNHSFAFFIDDILFRLLDSTLHSSWVKFYFLNRLFLSSDINFDFYGREQFSLAYHINSFFGKFANYTGKYDFLPSVKVDLVAVRKFPQIFSFGISIRMSHPVLYYQIRQLKNSHTIIEIGSPDFLSDYSTGTSFRFFNLFTLFKTRVSSLFHNSFLFVSDSYYVRFYSFFNKFGPNQYSVIFNNPASYYSGLLARNNLLDAGPITVSFSAYSTNSDFTIPVPHFFESSSELLPIFSSKFVKSTPVAQPKVTSANYVAAAGLYSFPNFSFVETKSSGTSYAQVSKVNLALNSVVSQSSIYHNSYNIILAKARNADYRHHHFCYLLLASWSGANHSTSSIRGISNCF